MGDINEILHVPDQENVSKLIEIIVEEFKRDVQGAIYTNSKEFGREMPNPYQTVFVLEPHENPCEWLGCDTEYHFRVNFGKPDAVVKSFFSVSDNGKGFVTLIGKNRRVIHGGKIFVELNIDFSSTSDLRRDPFVNKFARKFREVLRHEIGHAYREMFLCTNFTLDSDEKIKDTEAFKNAYSDVIYYQDHFITQNVENALMITLYVINYIERDPHITQFYQEVINDSDDKYKDKKTLLKPKDFYYSYSIYKDVLGFIKEFNDKEVFLKFRDRYIVPLLGKRCGTIEGFKKYVEINAVKVLHKMDTIYDSISKYGKLVSREEKFESIRQAYHSVLFENNCAEDVDRVIEEPFRQFVHRFLTMPYIRTKDDGDVASVEHVLQEKPYKPGKIPFYF